MVFSNPPCKNCKNGNHCTFRCDRPPAREQALVQAARAVFAHCHISGPASQLKDLANALAKYEGEY
jgi:hypothetical protein